MTKHVTAVELRVRLGEFIKAASQGTEFVIDYHGVSACRLVPLSDPGPAGELLEHAETGRRRERPRSVR